MVRNLIIAMMMTATFAQSSCAQTEYKIRLTFGTYTRTATLTDNSTTRAFIAKLPITLPMMDLYDNEMCYRFPEALPTDNAYDQSYEVGEILYWPPGHSFVIRYAQNGEVFEMQKLGKMDSGVDVFNGIGDIDVKFELIETTGIDDIKAEEKKDDRYYSLNGVAVKNPASGIYIKNHKKVVLKK